MQQKKVRNISSNGVKGISLPKDLGILWDEIYCSFEQIGPGSLLLLSGAKAVYSKKEIDDFDLESVKA